MSRVHIPGPAASPAQAIPSYDAQTRRFALRPVIAGGVAAAALMLSGLAGLQPIAPLPSTDLAPQVAYAAYNTETVTIDGLSIELSEGAYLYESGDDADIYAGKADGYLYLVNYMSEFTEYLREDSDIAGELLASESTWEAIAQELLDDRTLLGTETYTNDSVSVTASYFYDPDNIERDWGAWLVYDNANENIWVIITVIDDNGDFDGALDLFRSIGKSIEVAGSTSISSGIAAIRSSAQGGSSSSSGGSSRQASSSSSSAWIYNLRDFEPVTESGYGDDVVDIPRPGTACAMKIKHSGSDNFVVWGLDSSGEKVDLYVNEIGSYSGTTTTFGDSDEVASLAITADGSWSIEFIPLEDTPRATSGYTATGDGVVWLDEDSLRTLRFTHDGDSNFAVWAYGYSGDVDLLVNEIGDYRGTVSWNDPQCLLIVTADGEWSVSW